MGRRNRKRVSTVTSARAHFLLREIRGVRQDHTDAREAGSWSAVAALRRQVQSLRLEYDQEVERRQLEAQAAAAKDMSREMTAEERAEAVEQAAINAPSHELEIYVREWLDRLKYELEVDGNGVLHVVRR